MTDRRDRLTSMVAGTQSQPAPSNAPPPARQQSTRGRILLYAPPPAPGPAFVTILQSEGYDVLVATSAESAAVLLENSAPSLIVAAVPVLGEPLRELFRQKAPTTEIRVVPSLGALLEENVIPSGEATDFATRAIAAVAGILSSSRGVPRERTVRILQWSNKAAKALGFHASDVMAVRLAAALRDIPRILAPESQIKTEVFKEDAVNPSEREAHRKVLAEFAQTIRSPFRFAVEPPKEPAAGRLPTVDEVVEAAVEYAMLVEQKLPQPPMVFRKRALDLGLHPAAVEALIAAAGGEQPAAGRGKILVVDGDVSSRNLLALRLANEGYAVATSPDGRVALEMIRREPPALVLAEAVLPGLDGYGLLDKMKQEGHGGVPFVFMSSRNDPLSVNKGLLLGAADFLSKPLNTEVLLTKLQKLLGQKVAAADASARLMLSDLTHGATSAAPTVSYQQLREGVSILGRFTILSQLGEGGMGKVLKARDERLEEDVVIKVMKDTLMGDPRSVEHFKREIRLARKISHPAVVRIFDFWEADPLKFVTMEYLEGSDLSQEIKRRGAFPVPVAIRLAREFFEGLAVAHELGVVHRDIKPHNVLLLKGGHLKILDFGIAQALDAQSPDAGTVTTTVIGTPQYMSPEQIVNEKLDARTDLYSAGILFYELLTGQLPFRGADMVETVSMHLHAQPQPPSATTAGIPPEIDQLVLKLLAKSRNDRYQTAREVADDLWGLSFMA